MSRRHAAVWLAVAASTVFATLAGPGYASSADVAGRAFVLAPLSGAALGDQATRVAAAGDGTVWTIGAAGSLWRLGAGDLRPVRVFTGHAWSDLAALPDGGLVLASDVDRELFPRTRQGEV
jgi:hypothetical protein